jgi:C-terminal processing protease CtpA/Prc
MRLGYSAAMRSVFLMLLLFAFPLPVLATNSANNFGGIGIDGAPRADGEIVIRQIVLGGPAQQAGLTIGDVITHIDGKATRGSSFQQLVDYRLRGKAGTPVEITFYRPGGKSRKLTLIRRQLIVPPTNNTKGAKP